MLRQSGDGLRLIRNITCETAQVGNDNAEGAAIEEFEQFASGLGKRISREFYSTVTSMM
jgi:hypothetical protein